MTPIRAAVRATRTMAVMHLSALHLVLPNLALDRPLHVVEATSTMIVIGHETRIGTGTRGQTRAAVIVIVGMKVVVEVPIRGMTGIGTEIEGGVEVGAEEGVREEYLSMVISDMR